VAVISKKRIVYALVIVVVALGILSFVLPYVGGSQHGISP
jgi:hypothetical protein